MIVNPDKFKSIIIPKHKSPHEINAFQIGNNSVEITSSVKLLGISLDNQLNFIGHIENICKSASNQLNVLVRSKTFLGFEQKRILINSFLLSNFNYCPLVCCITSAKSLKSAKDGFKIFI